MGEVGPTQGELQGHGCSLFLFPLPLKTTSTSLKSSSVVLNSLFDILFIWKPHVSFIQSKKKKKINYSMPGSFPGDILVNETKLLTPGSFVFQKTRQKYSNS